MAKINPGGNGQGNRTRNSRNNNPEGRNQHSGVRGTLRDNPFTAAVAAGGAVAAGVFLWSRRNQISDRLGSLSDQVAEWRGASETEEDLAAGDLSGGGFTANSPSGRTQREIVEEALTLKETGNPA